MLKSARTQALISALQARILVIDGAMGTALQAKNLTAADFGGAELDGCNENLIFTRPHIIQETHEEYLRVGCDIVETNTFSSTPLSLNKYGLAHLAEEQNRLSAQIARKAAEKYSTSDKPRFVAGSLGPTSQAISVTGNVTFEALQENFYVQAKGLLEGGVDYLLFETCQDTRNIKAGILATERLFSEKGERIPVAVSVTIEPMGNMLAGQSIEALLASLAHLDLLYLGLNCATGPEFMTDSIRTLARLSPFRVACVPNAGLPDENGCYLETPSMMANVLSKFLSNGWINVIGGCCGSHVGHIQALVELAAASRPRIPFPLHPSLLSGVDYLEITEEIRPILVGDRSNVEASDKFKALICDEKFEEASELSRAQLKQGAQIIDVCLTNPNRDEIKDMRSFLKFAIKKIRAPLMIASTDPAVVELALTYCQGKALINSVSLENNEVRLKKIVPLVKKFGAALVVKTIDDNPQQGIGISRTRKLEIAERSYQLLTEKYGVPPEDIYWDPLVFPCGNGDTQYLGSAQETIEAIRLIKKRFPLTKTILRISNVSIGLPSAGREILNSVFLYHCVQAGLDLAIINAEKLVSYGSIPEAERKLSENLLYAGGIHEGRAPVAAFILYFRTRKISEHPGKDNQDDKASATVQKRPPLLERLSRSIIEGSKEGLLEDLTEALKTLKPLEIINGPLMKGMDEVGKLFSANKLIVAEVLQSAEAMKAAVEHLEPFMESSEAASRGTVMLATVKGDVHDIGKNLVEIILANNGFKIVNMGIKVPPERLIQAIREHHPDIIGLSGLLVKSAHQMVATVEDFAKAGITTPLMVGGAALSSKFVDKQIAKAYTTGTVAYAQDVMSGLNLAKIIVDPEQFEAFKMALLKKRAEAVANEALRKPATPHIEMPQQRSSLVPILADLPQPADLERHILRTTPIDQIWSYLNPLMLYGRHLGIRGGSVRLLEKAANNAAARKELESKDPKAVKIWDAVQEVKDEYRGTEIMQPSAIFQFFRASSRGNLLHFYPKEGIQPLVTFDFPRQKKLEGLCLADYIQPQIPRSPEPVAIKMPNKDKDKTGYSAEGLIQDTVGVFIVSVGKGVRQMAEYLKNKGDYLKSHVVQALALESAEAYAEMIHSQLRKTWGFPDAPETSMMDRFQAKYRGKRYSFGYPACPHLEDQSLLWKLIQPGEIGVQLTDGFMMDPEATVSAIVFHHPTASYFSVGQTSLEGDSNESNRQ
jgi:5-methyltetrahydrofolate--homocysteine methyltransferase